MIEYTNKIAALYSRFSVDGEDRDDGEINSIVNQKAFSEIYTRQHPDIGIFFNPPLEYLLQAECGGYPYMTQWKGNESRGVWGNGQCYNRSFYNNEKFPKIKGF